MRGSLRGAEGFCWWALGARQAADLAGGPPRGSCSACCALGLLQEANLHTSSTTTQACNYPDATRKGAALAPEDMLTPWHGGGCNLKAVSQAHEAGSRHNASAWRGKGALSTLSSTHMLQCDLGNGQE